MKVRFENGKRKGETVEVTERGIIIGRYGGCEIQIDEDGISRKHCQLKVVEGEFVIIDLDSTNGVVVDNKKIDKDAVLADGQLFQVFNYKFSCIYPEKVVEELEKSDDTPGSKKVLNLAINFFLLIILVALIYLVIYLYKNNPQIVH